MELSDSDQLYYNLRNKLDKLGYTQPFGFESFSLINALLSDVLHQQELYQNSNTDAKPSLKFINYKSHLATLLKKICELNESQCTLKLSFEKDLQFAKNKIMKLEEANANYRYRETHLIRNIKSVERDLRDKSRLLLKLEENNLKAIIQTPGGNKAPVPFKREKMVIDSFLPTPLCHQSPIIRNPEIIPQKASSPLHELATTEGPLKQYDLSQTSSSNFDETLTTVPENIKGQQGFSKHSIDIFVIADTHIKNLTVKLNDAELKHNSLEQEVIELKGKIRGKEEIIEKFVGPMEVENLIFGIKPGYDGVGKIPINIESQGMNLNNRLINEKFATKIDDDSLIDEERELAHMAKLKEKNPEYTDAFLKKLVDNVGHLKLKYDDLKAYLSSLEKSKLVDNLKYLEKEQETIELLEELEKIGEMTRDIRKHTPDTGIGSRETLSIATQTVIDEDKTTPEDMTQLKIAAKALKKINAKPSTYLDEKINKNHGLNDIGDKIDDDVFTSEESIENEGGLTKRKSPEENLKEKNKELEKVTKLYRRNLESKTNLTFRVNQLLKHEKELLQELEKLHHKTFLRSAGYSNNTRLALKARTDNLIADLEKDRNFYKDEYLYLVKYIDTHLTAAASATPTTNSNFNINAVSHQPGSKKDDLSTRVKHKEVSQSFPPPRYSEWEKGIENYNNMDGNALPAKPKHSSHKPDLNITDEFSVVEKLMQEKDDLQTALNECEREKERLRYELEKIQKEKENLEKVYKSQYPNTELEKQMDYMANENKRLKLEIKTKEESYTKHRNELEDHLANLIKMAEMLNGDRNKVNQRHKALVDEMQEVQHHLQSERENSRELKDVMLKITNESQELKHQTVHARELKQAHAVIKELHEKLTNLQRESLALRAQIDELTHVKIELEHTVTEKERMLVSLHGTMTKLESRINNLSTTLQTKCFENERITREMTDQAQLYERDRLVFLEENRILRADINTLTCEHKKINQELETLRRENNDLRDKTEVTHIQIKSVEEILSAKEQEKTGFIEQCKGLEKQIDAIRSQKRNLEVQLQNLKLECTSKEGQINHLSRRLATLESDSESNTADPLGTQMKGIKDRAVESLEREIAARLSEIEILKSNIARLEKVCTESLLTQNALKEALELKKADTVQLTQTIEDFKRDFRILKAEVESRRQSVKTLEQVLSCCRKRENDIKTYCRKLESKIRLYQTQVHSHNNLQENQNFPSAHGSSPNTLNPSISAPNLATDTKNNPHSIRSKNVPPYNVIASSENLHQAMTTNAEPIVPSAPPFNRLQDDKENIRTTRPSNNYGQSKNPDYDAYRKKYLESSDSSRGSPSNNLQRKPKERNVKQKVRPYSQNRYSPSLS